MRPAITQFPYKLVKRGKAVLTIRVTNYKSKGGIYGRPEDMKLSVKGKDPISLAGEWKYLSGLSLSGIPLYPFHQKVTLSIPQDYSMQ